MICHMGQKCYKNVKLIWSHLAPGAIEYMLHVILFFLFNSIAFLSFLLYFHTTSFTSLFSSWFLHSISFFFIVFCSVQFNGPQFIFVSFIKIMSKSEIKRLILLLPKTRTMQLTSLTKWTNPIKPTVSHFEILKDLPEFPNIFSCF